MEEDQPIDVVFGDRVRRFQEFLDRPEQVVGGATARTEIREMLTKGKCRLCVSLDDIREFDREFWQGLLSNPAEFLPACERALRDTVLTIYDPNDSSFEYVDDTQPFYLSFKGAFGANQVSPDQSRRCT